AVRARRRHPALLRARRGARREPATVPCVHARDVDAPRRLRARGRHGGRRARARPGRPWGAGAGADARVSRAADRKRRGRRAGSRTRSRKYAPATMTDTAELAPVSPDWREQTIGFVMTCAALAALVALAAALGSQGRLIALGLVACATAVVVRAIRIAP